MSSGMNYDKHKKPIHRYGGSGLHNRYWKEERKRTQKKDYVPLSDRDDWDGKVIKL